jgi:hypothetical protein
MGKLGWFLFSLASFTGGVALADSLPLSCLLFQGQPVAVQAPLGMSQHRAVLKSCSTPDGLRIGIREFQSSGRTYGLLLNPQNLKTRIVDLSCVRCTDTDFHQLPESNYKSAMRKQMAEPFPLGNKGISHSPNNKTGYFLSVDLCPSRKSFDASIFENAKVRNQRNFPVAIAITGGWMRSYSQEFTWLKRQHLAGQLDVTWVNHSYTHPYYRGVENRKNFLLTSGVSFAEEVLKQEQYMISNGLTPSVYFRFPGLISDKTVIAQLSSYGLLALGSDAWLGIGQKPTQGSVILIHGNGNEPKGINIFMQILQNLSSLEIFKPLTDLF